MYPDSLSVRRARVPDVPVIHSLVNFYAGRILLEKNLVTLYEAVQDFWVAEVELPDDDAALPTESIVADSVDTVPAPERRNTTIVGCAALHVLWSDLAELRTVAVRPDWHGKGVGHALVRQLIEHARDLQLSKLFVLTFETHFFSKHGFIPLEGTPVTPEVYQEMLKSYDQGVAEFLDLSSIKPNTLGNTRMLCLLR